MGDKLGAPPSLIINGKRLDGRTPEEFRPISLESGVLTRAMGSGIFKFGDTYALAAVFGPRPFHPKFKQDPQMAVLRCRYAMAPFSTQDRSRPGPSRRAVEISKVIKEALSNVIFFEDYPRTGIDVYIEILQADASTRCAGINAASLALADAGVPLRDLVIACTVGRIDGVLIRDVSGVEDNFGEVDMAVATVGLEDKVVLLQMDGIITKDEFLKLLSLAKDGCDLVYKKLKAALRERFTPE
jgi:exosome complex component RRP41